LEGTSQVIFTVIIFLVCYAFIITEKVHRTIIAALGGAIMVVSGVLDQHTALENIDFNTLGLLVGMMIIVAITKESGVFEFLAISAVKVAKGKPMAILLWLSAMTAFVSAFIDSVTCVLLVIPVTISIAQKLNISPIPLVFSEVMLCNIGGAATLIGDPPNIMIGSAAGFSFGDFVRNMAPILVVIAAVTLVALYFMFRKQLVKTDTTGYHVMEINPWDEIKNKKLMTQSLIVLGITILGFLFHDKIAMEPATIALAGAALLLILARPNPEHVLKAVEWPVIFFFIGLFVLVGGLKEVGVMHAIAERAISITGGELLPTGMGVLWVSSLASAFVDNIPFTATLIPIIQDMGALGHIANMDAIWWSFALGACLGGNGTIVAASANVVAIGMLDEHGYKLSFLRFMRWGFPLMVMSIGISAIYLYFFYLT